MCRGGGEECWGPRGEEGDEWSGNGRVKRKDRRTLGMPKAKREGEKERKAKREGETKHPHISQQKETGKLNKVS